MGGISGLAEDRLSAEEGLYSMELVRLTFYKKVSDSIR